ncbi:MAG: protein-glutamate O-methyltransferase CheR [candidate division NC10 bacterium]|nr:protein-glutamate O-methyltransferase CheR [candidate division NC10 bacterium]
MGELKEPGWQKLRDLVREKGGIDLALYGESYLRRRLAILLRSKGCATLEEYVGLLTADPQEVELFVNSFILRVTEFFRSPTTFEALEQRILPALFSQKRKQFSHVVRAWSAGCSSGEEPYSLAILMRESLKKEKEGFSILIFATDIDQKSLMAARKGAFHPSKLKKVNPAWRDTYFRRRGEEFLVSEEIRKMVVFRVHNLVDPLPYRNLDLILFRNVLIYLKPEVQRSLLESFFEILNPGGYLVLGRTEGGGGTVPSQYEIADLGERIYQRPLQGSELHPFTVPSPET